MNLPDVDEAIRNAPPTRRQKLKLIAWLETQPEDVQDWIWTVFERCYINGAHDCMWTWRIVQTHIPNTPEIAHQAMKRGVDAHFAGR